MKARDRMTLAKRERACKLARDTLAAMRGPVAETLARVVIQLITEDAAAVVDVLRAAGWTRRDVGPVVLLDSPFGRISLGWRPDFPDRWTVCRLRGGEPACARMLEPVQALRVALRAERLLAWWP